MPKICSKCGVEKSDNDYYKHNKSWCKDCVRLYQNIKWHERMSDPTNRQKVNESARIRKKENYNKDPQKYIQQNIRYRKQRRLTDPEYAERLKEKYKQYNDNRKKINMVTIDDNRKYCYYCKQIMPHSSFNKNKSRKDGYSDECRNCRKIQNKIRNQKKKDKK